MRSAVTQSAGTQSGVDAGPQSGVEAAPLSVGTPSVVTLSAGPQSGVEAGPLSVGTLSAGPQSGVEAGRLPVGTPSVVTLFGVEAGPQAPRAVTVAETVRVRLVVAYTGTGFHGFVLQPGLPTVAGALCAALERQLRHTVVLVCAGRTDAGVHAWGQVVSFDARVDVDLPRLQRNLNRTLRPGIAVRHAEIAAPDFNARYDATGRRYHYTVLNRPVGDPFVAGTSWHVERPLDLAAMRLACDPLYGEQDFSSFCRRPPRGSLVRLVRDARWVPAGEGLLRFEIEATSFCQQMVRSVVGTLVEIGLGRRRAGDMVAILRARDRSVAAQPAPPHGLTLWDVSY
jgi:tRNA pseudouridine38-40 synthase